MKFKAEIDIMPLEALLDPPGKAVTSALTKLDLAAIQNVRIGKHITLTVEAKDQKSAESLVESACTRLLCNAIMEHFHFTVTPLN